MASDVTTLFLLRHAAHDRVDRVLCGRMPGVHLGERGRAQAAQLAERVARERCARIYASPQPRAQETAAIVAERLSLPLIEEPALNEIAFGAWTGLAFDQLDHDPRWQAWNAARAAGCPPAGESMAAVQQRAMAWMQALPARHGGGAIAAVSHADVIKAMLCGLLELSMDQHARFEIAPASISTVVLWPGGGKVIGMNEVVAP